jgi:homoserine O-acetyltransferase
METKIFKSSELFTLESGYSIENLQIAYTDTGFAKGKKTVWVCHALSGNADVFDWWSGLFGEYQLFNESEYRVICANILGSCYGSSGPTNWNEFSIYSSLTIRDIVHAHLLLRKELNLSTIDILIGASIGGQQAIEWAIQEPFRIKKLILIATNAAQSSFGKAFNEAQRLALQADATFGIQDGGKSGLKAARALAMISYRSYEDFAIKQGDDQDKSDNFNACSYLAYQGQKFVDRFSPLSYFSITKAMDSHNVGHGRGGLKAALNQIQAQTLVVNVSSDFLFPLCEQAVICKHIPHVQFGRIDSIHGHDAFLIEYKQLNSLISNFLYKSQISKYLPLKLNYHEQ